MPRRWPPPPGQGAPIRLAQLRAEVGSKLLAAQEHAGLVASFDSDLLYVASKLGWQQLGKAKGARGNQVNEGACDSA